MNDAIPHVRTQGSAAGSKQPHRKDKCSFYSTFQEQSLTCQLSINLYFCFGAPQPFLSLLCFLSHSVETVPSESNKFYNIPSEKKICLVLPWPHIPLQLLQRFVCSSPQSNFLKGFSTQTVSTFHISNLLFSQCCLTSAAITHQKQSLSELTTSCCQMQLSLFLLHLSESFEWTDKLSTRTAFFYSPQDTTLSWISSCLTIFLLPLSLSFLIEPNGWASSGPCSVQHTLFFSSQRSTFHLI